ncbi:hypothetical protein Tco_0948856 [Tanacetum coccineum]
MAESSKQEQTPPHQSTKQDQPEEPGTPIPLNPITQVDFNLDEITFKENNEVALIYLDHPNKEHFKVISDFISKCCLREAFTRTPIQYKEYLMEFWYIAKVLKDYNRVWFSTLIGGIKREVGVTYFRNAIGENYLANSRNYEAVPSIETVKQWFPIIGYSGTIEATCTLKKGFLPPSWSLLMAQIIQCLGGKTSGFDQISNKDAIIFFINIFVNLHGRRNPIRTLGDYSKPSHEGYRNAIELLEASNWLERLPAGSISTWEDLTTRFLA